MLSVEEKMKQRLAERQQAGLLRVLPPPLEGLTDFCSNDYLGLARNLSQPTHPIAGATGSRLISGNTKAAEELEKIIAQFHGAEAALLFPSGYLANIGLLPAICSRHDTIIYDKLLHASLRDGIGLSPGKAYSFAHNDLADLEKKLQRAAGEKWVVVESVYSMDGDQAPLTAMADICQRYQANLIVDEAHGTGVVGRRGEGLVAALGLESAVWARIHTFGKAMGSHGAAILGSTVLKDFLINFARSFIYTTALPPATIAHLAAGYQTLQEVDVVAKLRARVTYFVQACPANVRKRLIASTTPVQAVLCPGNEAVQHLANYLQIQKIAILPIRYPTVPQGEERIRICLHTFNTNEEIDRLLACLDSYFSDNS
ncbi:MAG: 8-amino-7-oxononanoate synthase [Bacteroidota bacterium]